MPIAIDIPTARRFLAIRHLLAPPRSLPGTPEGILAVVDRLGSLQFDPLEVAGRNHDLILHARVSGYGRGLTDELLYGRRLLFETWNKGLSLLPTRELPWYRVGWKRAESGWSAGLLVEQEKIAARVLDEIAELGPRSSTDFEREASIDWWWGPTSAVRAVMEALLATGRIAIARREGNRRYFDLTERLFPPDLLATEIPEREQVRHKVLSRYRGHGLLGTGGPGDIWVGTGYAPARAELRRDLLDRGELVAVTVDGLRGDRYMIADELPLLTQAEREMAAGRATPGDAPGDRHGTVFLAPLDPLMWDRDLLVPLYGFEYRWEVYTPAAKRRWGYYVLPILFGDRIVGRIEPRLDRRGGAVRILGLSWEEGFEPLGEPGFVESFAEALGAYLEFGGATVLIPPTGQGHARLTADLAERLPVATSD
jgi:uncharacterized protein